LVVLALAEVADSGWETRGAPKQPHVRPGDQLDDEDTIVIRGGAPRPDMLRVDALRYHSIYGEYGISVFAARDAAVEELAQQVPLVRFEILTLVRVGDPRAVGFRLEPTGRSRRHFTVASADLEEGVRALEACEHRRWTNPYHGD
jgi:hypothetical protein